MKQALRVVLVLVALQAAAWLGWQALRSEPAAPFLRAATSGSAPELAPRNGLVHVWATWCGPCRDELPALLDAARVEGVPLVAVSVDTNPASVEAFFGDAVPAEVRIDPSVAALLDVRELPATFLVVEGQLVERMDGARAWDAQPAREWMRLVGRRREPP